MQQLIIWLTLLLVAVPIFIYVDFGVGVVILCSFLSGWYMAREKQFFYSNFEFYIGLMVGGFILCLMVIIEDFQNPLLVFLICTFFYSLSYIFSYYIWLDFEKMWERLGCKSAMENLDFDCGEEFD